MEAFLQNSKQGGSVHPSCCGVDSGHSCLPSIKSTAEVLKALYIRPSTFHIGSLMVFAENVQESMISKISSYKSVREKGQSDMG
jgi:hypothetical protein